MWQLLPDRLRRSHHGHGQRGALPAGACLLPGGARAICLVVSQLCSLDVSQLCSLACLLYLALPSQAPPLPCPSLRQSRPEASNGPRYCIAHTSNLPRRPCPASALQAIGRLSGVQLYRMGQTNVLARYPAHFHQIGNNANRSYIQDSSIWRSFYRCVSLHAVNGLTVTRNVAYDAIGHWCVGAALCWSPPPPLRCCHVCGLAPVERINSQ
jgi:hypothetical protein